MNELDTEKIYSEYRTKVFSYIIGKLGRYHDAEDLCEDVFVKVFQKIDTFDENKASLSTWIYNITRNTVIDYYRAHKDTLELNEEIFNVDEEKVDEEMLEQLALSLNKLDEQLRDIIVLRYYSGYSLTEISQMMNISYGITKLRHKEALNKLNGMLKNYR